MKRWLVFASLFAIFSNPQAGLSAAPWVPPPPSQVSNMVSIRLEPGAIESNVKERLFDLGALTIEKIFPGFSSADTAGADINGNPVTLIDLSGYYYLRFPHSRHAVGALPSLMNTPGVLYAELISGAPATVMSPNDPYLDYWAEWLPVDAQWNLQNVGARSEPTTCGRAGPGFDIQVSAIPEWNQGGGDPNIVIGVVDVGIFDDHGDLNVINNLLPDPTLFSLNPSIDFCGVHGTRMAGFAGALTNNAIGIAGICPNCSILDIEIARCDAGICELIEIDPDYNPDCKDVVEYFQWPEYVNNAIMADLPDSLTLVTLIMSFGRVHDYGQFNEFPVLWNAYLLGIVAVSSSGNLSNATPEFSHPSVLPFVIGAGGYNWKGLFWEKGNTCITQDDNGTTVGPGNITICAPASGWMPAADAWNRGTSQPEPYYSLSQGKTSGASAQVSGAIGLIQSIAKQRHGAYLSADDVIGLIEGTALPFAEDPANPTSYTRQCDVCAPEDYGKGRLNIAGIIESLDHPWTETVLGPEDVTITWVRDFFAMGRTWAVFLVEGEMGLGLLSQDSKTLPDYVGWARRAASNTYTPYGLELDQEYRALFLAEEGVHDCKLTYDAGGNGLVRGYLYGWRDGESIVYEGPYNKTLTRPDNVELRVINVSTIVTDVDHSIETQRPETQGPGLILHRNRNPVLLPVGFHFTLQKEEVVHADILDVRGRVVRKFAQSSFQKGSHSFFWEGRDANGNLVPTGVYWIDIRSDGERDTGKILVIR